MPNYNTLLGARDWVGMPGGMRGSGGGEGGQGVWTPSEFPGSAHGEGGGNLFHWDALGHIA